jgi:hypothetical protein
MSRPSFFQGALIAAGFALTGAIAFTGLSFAVGGAVALKMITVALGGGYVLYLLRASSVRSGRVTLFSAWSVVTASMWVLNPDLFVMLVTQTLLISLVRSLYHHKSLFAAFVDLLLSAFALSAAAWASAQTGSIFLTVWCFFLVQALFAALPTATKHEATGCPEDEFDRAQRAAETAIRRIATQR